MPDMGVGEPPAAGDVGYFDDIARNTADTAKSTKALGKQISDSISSAITKALKGTGSASTSGMGSTSRVGGNYNMSGGGSATMGATRPIGGGATFSGQPATGSAGGGTPAGSGGGGASSSGFSTMNLSGGGLLGQPASYIEPIVNWGTKKAPEWMEMDLASRQMSIRSGQPSTRGQYWSAMYGGQGQKAAIAGYNTQDITSAWSTMARSTPYTNISQQIQAMQSMGDYGKRFMPGASASQVAGIWMQGKNPEQQNTLVSGMGYGATAEYWQYKLGKNAAPGEALARQSDFILQNYQRGHKPMTQEQLAKRMMPGSDMYQDLLAAGMSEDQLGAMSQQWRQDLMFKEKHGGKSMLDVGYNSKTVKDFLKQSTPAIDKYKDYATQGVKTTSIAGLEGGIQGLTAGLDAATASIDKLNDTFAPLLGAGGAVSGFMAPFNKFANIVKKVPVVGKFLFGEAGGGTQADVSGGTAAGGGVGSPATGTAPTSGSGGGAAVTTAGTTNGAASRSQPGVNGDEVVAFARQQLGKTYRSGATGPGSFDCSGLTTFVFKHFGVGLPRTAAAQSSWGGLQKISVGDAKAGDLVFWYSGKKGRIGHVGIASGNGRVIDASSSQNKVVERKVWEGAGFTLSGAGRIKGVNPGVAGNVGAASKTNEADSEGGSSGSGTSASVGGGGGAGAMSSYSTEEVNALSFLQGVPTSGGSGSGSGTPSSGSSTPTGAGVSSAESTPDSTSVAPMGDSPSKAGVQNGKIPSSMLADIGGGFKLWSSAAAKFKDMRSKYKQDTGKDLGISSAYRSYEQQQSLYARRGSNPYPVAAPGKSNHGWGLAVDVNLPGADYTNPTFKWLSQNAGKYGFATIKNDPVHWQAKQAGIGIWDVDQDITVRAHKGEMILQKEAAEAFRSAAPGGRSGGGVTLQFNEGSVVINTGGSSRGDMRQAAADFAEFVAQDNRIKELARK